LSAVAAFATGVIVARVRAAKATRMRFFIGILPSLVGRDVRLGKTWAYARRMIMLYRGIGSMRQMRNRPGIWNKPPQVGMPLVFVSP
jgi:hypothetical protein